MIPDYAGQFFHTFHPDGSLNRQGYVVGRREDGRYDCQLFDWFVGFPSDHVTMTADQLGAARLYPTADQWHGAARDGR